MPITGQKMRSSIVDDPKLDGDLWLQSKDTSVISTVRLHDDYIEHLTWDAEAPSARRITSIILDRQTGQTFSAQAAHQAHASAAAKNLAGVV